MLSRKYFAFMAAALFMAGSLAAMAQTAPVRGKVEMKNADGTTVPVAGAKVDVYRTDAKGKPPSGKTNKKGEFAFAGLPLGQKFAFVVSGEKIKSEIQPNITAGVENVVITVVEGDGKVLTEEEVRAALSGNGKPAQQNTAQTTAQPTAEQPAAQKTDQPQRQPTEKEIADAKKAKAEYDKQVADVTAKNQKIEKNTSVINAALKDGSSAFDAKNYDLAIAKFDEGYNADPEYAGSAPILLNNKALALRLRGFDAYKQSTTDAANKAALMEKAKKDFTDAADAGQKGLTILKGATTTDANLQKEYAASKYNTLTNLVEVYRLMILTKADTTKSKEAMAVYQEYFEVEPDAAKKAKAQLQIGDIMREAGDSENAIIAYKKVLETTPDNVDAMAGLGLSLFSAGVGANDKTQMQEGLNYMQKFADTAPASHPLKSSVKDAVDYLKTEQKLAPQKVDAPSKAKKKT